MGLSTTELAWWIAAFGSYGVGDYLTTVVAVQRYSVVEANPVVRRLLSRHPGPIGFAVLKLGTLAVCFAGFLAIADSQLAVGIPIAIAGIGLVVTASNLRAILHSRSASSRRE